MIKVGELYVEKQRYMIDKPTSILILEINNDLNYVKYIVNKNTVTSQFNGLVNFRRVISSYYSLKEKHSLKKYL